MLGAMWVSGAPSVVLMRRSNPNARVVVPVTRDLAGREVLDSAPIKVDLSWNKIKQRVLEQKAREEELQKQDEERRSAKGFPNKNNEILDAELEEEEESSKPSMWTHTLDFLWRHTIYLFFVWLIICIIEGDRIQTDPNLSQFNILFEIIAGYSGCGISIG